MSTAEAVLIIGGIIAGVLTIGVIVLAVALVKLVTAVSSIVHILQAAFDISTQEYRHFRERRGRLW